MKPTISKKLVKSSIALAIINACYSQAAVAQNSTSEDAAQEDKKVEKIMVTANRYAQDIQEVSSSITALDAEDVERAGIIDITGLENVVPGLKVSALANC